MRGSTSSRSRSGSVAISSEGYGLCPRAEHCADVPVEIRVEASCGQRIRIPGVALHPVLQQPAEERTSIRQLTITQFDTVGIEGIGDVHGCRAPSVDP